MQELLIEKNKKEIETLYENFDVAVLLQKLKKLKEYADSEFKKFLDAHPHIAYQLHDHQSVIFKKLKKFFILELKNHMITNNIEFIGNLKKIFNRASYFFFFLTER